MFLIFLSSELFQLEFPICVFFARACRSALVENAQLQHASSKLRGQFGWISQRIWCRRSWEWHGWCWCWGSRFASIIEYEYTVVIIFICWIGYSTRNIFWHFHDFTTKIVFWEQSGAVKCSRVTASDFHGRRTWTDFTAAQGVDRWHWQYAESEHSRFKWKSPSS